jgi:hypothetical protein
VKSDACRQDFRARVSTAENVRTFDTTTDLERDSRRENPTIDTAGGVGA